MAPGLRGGQGRAVSVAPQAFPDEIFSEHAVRPRSLDEVVGLGDVKRRLRVMIEACRRRRGVLEHLLFVGPPGLGKTTLAYVVAAELGVEVRATSGPALARVADAAALLTSLERGQILFVDEVHRLPKAVEEIFYPALEQFELDVTLGKGTTAKTLRLKLAPFTLIGATTKQALISGPLRDRFGQVFQLDFYREEELTEIVMRSAKVLGIPIAKKAAQRIAASSRGTPRVANRLLRRVRDYAEVSGDKAITEAIAREALEFYGIDGKGLSEQDTAILRVLCVTFGGRPVGLSTIAAAVGEEPATIESLYEPHLIRAGLVVKTPRGRQATREAFAHLDLPPPRDG